MRVICPPINTTKSCFTTKPLWLIISMRSRRVSTVCSWIRHARQYGKMTFFMADNEISACQVASSFHLSTSTEHTLSEASATPVVVNSASQEYNAHFTKVHTLRTMIRRTWPRVNGKTVYRTLQSIFNVSIWPVTIIVTTTAKHIIWIHFT